MNFKYIDKKFLILCFDRLTRPKPSFEKYSRVFKDILDKYYLDDKTNLPTKEVIKIVTKIFNSSVQKINSDKKDDNFINQYLISQETKMFFQDKESEMYIKARLDFGDLVEVISNEKNLPQNLLQLTELNKNRNISPDELKKQMALKFPISKIILSEGATEEILLCEFAKKIGYDFDKEGIQIIGAGGKNQVARKYYKMVDEIKLPIFILLDSDAEQIKEMILPKLRKTDKIHLIKSGEFEDVISKDLIVKAVNNHFKNEYQIKKTDFNPEYPTVKNLKEIFKNKGFGDFNKSQFAKIIKDYMHNKITIMPEMEEIIEEIKKL